MSDYNFTCSSSGLSRTNLTDIKWMFPEGSFYEAGVTAVGICQVIILAIGVPWNIIVLAAIMARKGYKDPTYILLINLVMADLLVCLLVLPFNVKTAFDGGFYIANSDYTRCQACHAISIILTAMILLSMFTLASMAIDRLIYIKHPLRYSTYVTVKRVLLLLSLEWVLSILISIPPVFGFGDIRYAFDISACFPLREGQGTLANNIYYFIVLVMANFLLFLVTACANICLLVTTLKFIKHRRQKRELTQNNLKNPMNGNHNIGLSSPKENCHLALVFGTIFITNIVTWMPIIAIVPLQLALSTKDATVIVQIAYVSAISQPAIHPLIEICLLGKARAMLLPYFCHCIKKLKNTVF